MLAESDRAAVRLRLAEMVAPVRLLFFTQQFDCESCGPAKRILDEVVGLSPLLSIVEANPILDRDDAAKYGVDRAPTIVVLRGSTDDPPPASFTDVGVRLIGAPAGYEFMSLIEAIVAVSQGDSGLSTASRERLAAVSSPLHIQVFTTPG